jgi:hypothetical protein
MDAAQFTGMKYRFDQGVKVAQLGLLCVRLASQTDFTFFEEYKMKRTALILSLLFICGCNGSDSTTTSNNSGLSTPAKVSLVPAN